MADIRYRMYLEKNAATRTQLDLIEEVTVDQAINKAWEARLLLKIATDDKGVWTGKDPAFEPKKRVRLEIDAGSGKWQPLIDGPIVGSDQTMSSEPGQSTATLIVMDDSVYLNREEDFLMFSNKLDHEIAAQIYHDAEHIESTDVSADTKPALGGFVPFVFHKGTAMEVLRKIAARQGMHAYVLPGREPDTSIGVFKRLPTKPDGLKDLILLGPNRNIASLAAKKDDQSPASVQAFAIRLSDKTVNQAISTFRDVDLLGDKPAAASLATATKRLLPAGKDGSTDPKAATEAAARKLSMAFEASGSVMSECYKASLSPYRAVSVFGIESRLAGVYVVKKVTHRLTRYAYEQSFTLMRNAETDDKKAFSNLMGAIF
jgi:hypothetical protein